MKHADIKAKNNRLVMDSIVRHWNQYYCMPTLAELAADTDLAGPSIYHIKKRLIELGELVDTGKSYVPAYVLKG